MTSSRCTKVSKLDEQTIICEFVSHWVLHKSDLVPQLSNHCYLKTCVMNQVIREVSIILTECLTTVSLCQTALNLVNIRPLTFFNAIWIFQSEDKTELSVLPITLRRVANRGQWNIGHCNGVVLALELLYLIIMFTNSSQCACKMPVACGFSLTGWFIIIVHGLLL